MGLLDLFRQKLKGGSQRPPLSATCPKCKTKIDTSMERCPGCGTHISSMFRLECPKCKTPNEMNAKECVKCHELLAPRAPGEEPAKPYYLCPRCGYKADFYMLQCPSCGVKFS